MRAVTYGVMIPLRDTVTYVIDSGGSLSIFLRRCVTLLHTVVMCGADVALKFAHWRYDFFA